MEWLKSTGARFIRLTYLGQRIINIFCFEVMMLLQGDCLVKLRELPDCSVDSIVTDPPAGISFMNKSWDSDKGGRDNWIKWLSEIMTESTRVLKPGGHALVWAIPRTSHWTATAIEDAGFEIRDIVHHIFGTGFPKSHNLKDDWQGWGSALKPACENWILARKPLEKGLTLADNVLKHGTGALNIDGSRIKLSDSEPDSRSNSNAKMSSNNKSWVLANKKDKAIEVYNKEGRWPANIIFDEAAAEMLDQQSIAGGIHSAGKTRKPGTSKQENANSMFLSNKGSPNNGVRFDDGDKVGASRFFYVAKASKRERGTDNVHPTVKPIKLMEYLIKLVTPPNGTTLDPFMGSGSTGVAAKNLGFKFIGIELSEEYFEIAQKRIGFKKEKQLELEAV